MMLQEDRFYDDRGINPGWVCDNQDMAVMSPVKGKSRNLLYCRTCGKRFASINANALFGLHLSAETI